MRLIAPMLPPLTGLIVGILANRIGAGMGVASILIISGLSFYFFLTYKNSKPLIAYKYAKWHHIWIFVLFAGIGTLDAAFNAPPKLDSEITGNNYPLMKGYVRDVEYTTSGDRLHIELYSLIGDDGQTYKITPAGAIIYSKFSDIRVDDVVILSNTLSPILDSPDSFHSGYAQSMANRGILYIGFLGDNHFLNVIGRQSSLKGVAWECRQYLIEFIENTQLSIPAQSFIISILLGERSYFDRESKDIFSNAGISHILALSGMHVGIITSIILGLLFPLNIFRRRFLRYILVIPIIWGYAWITGLMPSTVRAALMTTIFIGAILIERKNSAWNSLLAATFLILLFSPIDIYDIGLQLSFTCVAGIIFFAGNLNPVNHHSHPVVYRLMELILVSLIATGCSWVISAYYFGNFPVMFLPANILFLPLLPFFIVLVLIYLGLYAAGIPINILASCINRSYDGFTRFLSYLSHDGNSTISLHLPALSLWCWLIALILLVILINQRKSLYAAIVPALLMVFSIGIIPVLSALNDKEIIVKSKGRYPEISFKDGNNITDYRFPVNSISSLKAGDYRFIVADCDIDTIKMSEIIDYLIITRSCTTPLPIIKEQVNPSTLIIHPSVSRAREEYLMNLADSLSIPVHSLRLNSSIRVRAFLE